jgi:hypothetical protein
MTYNPLTLCWEGNENTLTHFDIPPPLETPTPSSHQPQTSYMDRMDMLPPPSASPPRPALIAPMSAANMQVNGGMVFDPHQMKWLKIRNGRDVSGQLSPAMTDDEEEDVFAGLEDLKDSVPTFGLHGQHRLGRSPRGIRPWSPLHPHPAGRRSDLAAPLRKLVPRAGRTESRGRSMALGSERPPPYPRPSHVIRRTSNAVSWAVHTNHTNEQRFRI